MVSTSFSYTGGGILLNGTTGGDNFSHNIVRDAVSISKRRALQESKQPEISMMQSTQVHTAFLIIFSLNFSNGEDIGFVCLFLFFFSQSFVTPYLSPHLEYGLEISTQCVPPLGVVVPFWGVH